MWNDPSALGRKGGGDLVSCGVYLVSIHGAAERGINGRHMSGFGYVYILSNISLIFSPLH